MSNGALIKARTKVFDLNASERTETNSLIISSSDCPQMYERDFELDFVDTELQPKCFSPHRAKDFRITTLGDSSPNNGVRFSKVTS